MFAAVTHIKTKSLDPVSEMAKKKNVPDIKMIPGFVAYYAFLGEDKKSYTTIAVFEDLIGYEKWTALCRKTFASAKQYLVDDADAVHTWAGHVIHSRTAP